jgi:hypothetical protein
MSRSGVSQPIQPFATHGFVGNVPANGVLPGRVTVVEADDRSHRRRYAPVQATAGNGLYAISPQQVVTPPPLTIIDRQDQRARYLPLAPISLSAALASVTAAPTPAPPAPFVVPLEERKRFLAALPPNIGHGLDDPAPPPAETVEPQRRRDLPVPPISISGVLASFPPAPFTAPPNPYVYVPEGPRRPTPQPLFLSGALAGLAPPAFVQPPPVLVVFVDGKQRLVPQPIVLCGPAFPDAVVGAIYTQAFGEPNPGGAGLRGTAAGTSSAAPSTTASSSAYRRQHVPQPESAEERMSAGYEVVLAFDTDDPQFVRGFEAGRLWERIKGRHTTWDQMVHATNAEMVMRMCESEGRQFSADTVTDDWVMVTVV